MVSQTKVHNANVLTILINSFLVFMFASLFQTFFNDNDTKRNFVQPDFHMDTNNNSSIKTFFCYFFYFSNRKEVFHFGVLVFIFVIIKVSARHLGIESVIEKSNHELRVTKRMN